jgi:hypothetical protein
MSTLRPYGAWVLFDALNYKHCVPTGLSWVAGELFEQSLCASNRQKVCQHGRMTVNVLPWLGWLATVIDPL